MDESPTLGKRGGNLKSKGGNKDRMKTGMREEKEKRRREAEREGEIKRKDRQSLKYIRFS